MLRVCHVITDPKGGILCLICGNGTCQSGAIRQDLLVSPKFKQDRADPETRHHRFNLSALDVCRSEPSRNYSNICRYSPRLDYGE